MKKIKKRTYWPTSTSPLLYCLPVARTDIDCLVRGYHHQLHTFTLEKCLFDFYGKLEGSKFLDEEYLSKCILRRFYVRELVLFHIFPQTWQVVSIPIQMCLPIWTQCIVLILANKLSLLLTYIFHCWKGHQIEGQPIYNVRIHNVTFSL